MLDQSPHELNLIILAAGMGSRYGGLKQLDPVGPKGETILDYSLHDALSAGFQRFVFVVRKHFSDDFEKRLKQRWPQLQAVCVHQEIDDLPRHTKPNPERTKPWGTGHAVLAAKAAVTGPFAVINADDFYGPKSFQLLAEFLRRPTTENRACPVAMVGYQLAQTLSAGGAVSRGVCSVAKGRLQHIVEHTRIARDDDGIIRSSDGNQLPDDSVVSMNCWGMPKAFMNEIEHQFRNFILLHQNDLKREFYLPASVDAALKRGKADVSVLPTNESWFGITYPEDRETVVTTIADLVAAGRYASPLGTCTS